MLQGSEVQQHLSKRMDAIAGRYRESVKGRGGGKRERERERAIGKDRERKRWISESKYTKAPEFEDLSDYVEMSKTSKNCTHTSIAYHM